MRSSLVTVITTIRNGAPYILETIRSVQAQEFSDWNYLIVDDASTDETAAVVEQAAKQDARLRLLRRSESGGPYVAANDALRQATGKYVMRTDGDDLQPPHRFGAQLAYLSSHPGYRACISYWQPFDDVGLRPNPVTVPSGPALRWHLLLRSPSVHSSLCIERAAMEELGGYRNLPLSQDYRLWCDLTMRDWLGVIPEVLSHVRLHPGRSTNTRGELQRKLARDVLHEHFRTLAGTDLVDSEVEALWAVGYSLPYEVKSGLAMLDRWNALWQSDGSLDDETRRELESLAHVRRQKFLWTNLRHQPMSAALETLKTGWGSRLQGVGAGR